VDGAGRIRRFLHVTLPLYVAQRAVDSKDFGYGSALTMAGFVILLFCSILYLRLSRFGEER
jgi:multiple sugar transport system permease protein